MSETGSFSKVDSWLISETGSLSKTIEPFVHMVVDPFKGDIDQLNFLLHSIFIFINFFF